MMLALWTVVRLVGAVPPIVLMFLCYPFVWVLDHADYKIEWYKLSDEERAEILELFRGN